MLKFAAQTSGFWRTCLDVIQARHPPAEPKASSARATVAQQQSCEVVLENWREVCVSGWQIVVERYRPCVCVWCSTTS